MTGINCHSISNIKKVFNRTKRTDDYQGARICLWDTSIVPIPSVSRQCELTARTLHGQQHRVERRQAPEVDAEVQQFPELCAVPVFHHTVKKIVHIFFIGIPCPIIVHASFLVYSTLRPIDL